jgi:hypothetical protein
MGRFGMPSDIIGAVLYLASDSVNMSQGRRSLWMVDGRQQETLKDEEQKYPYVLNTPLQLHAIFHLNLAYSSIEEDQRPEVVRRCYWRCCTLLANSASRSVSKATGVHAGNDCGHRSVLGR